MTGQNLAVAGFDVCGTQGHGTSDKRINGVRSIYWNEKDTQKHYVNGFAISEVPANKNTVKTQETIVFTCDNDSDAVSDFILLVETPSTFAPAEKRCPAWVLAFLIERIEICVGNQVISTITTAGLIKDILHSSNRVQGDGTLFRNGQMLPIIHHTSPASFSTTFNLNAFNTFKDGLNCSYLMACSNNQTLQVKVHPFNLGVDDINTFVGPSDYNPIVNQPADGEYTFRLFCKKCTMTNDERDFLRNQEVHKRTNVTQTSSRLSVKTYTELLATNEITINCDNFNINTECIFIIAANIARITAGIDCELFLNSSSYSSIIPAQIMQQSDELSMTRIASDAAQRAARDDGEANFIFYKIPLGNSGPTDQDFVPLNRYNSIRVILRPSNAGNASDTPRTFGELAGGAGVQKSFFETLCVVAVGKCTASYRGGAVTFNTF